MVPAPCVGHKDGAVALAHWHVEEHARPERPERGAEALAAPDRSNLPIVGRVAERCRQKWATLDAPHLTHQLVTLRTHHPVDDRSVAVDQSTDLVVVRLFLDHSESPGARRLCASLARSAAADAP